MGVFGADNVYFEVQNNKIPEQDRPTRASCGSRGSSAGRWSAPPTSTTCAARTTTRTRRCCACRRSRRWREPKLRFDTNEFYLKSPEEMAESFAAVAGGGADLARDRRALRHRAGARQHAAADAITTPDGCEPDRYLRQLDRTGAARALRRPAARRRASSGSRPSLRVIEEMGFESYFLIVWDFVKYAKDNGIAVGPGRGSAAGSIVSYVPAASPTSTRSHYDLMFERFLNPERKIDAGHRHRLLDPRPRARDPLRAGQVRRATRSRRSSPSAR